MLAALAGPAKISTVVALVAAWGAISDRSDAEFASPVGASSSRAQEGAATGLFHGVGVVTAVDNAKGWLTLDHEAIKGFMCAMEMMYRVDPGALAAGLHVGDRIAFDIDAARETVVGVKALAPAK